MTVKAEYNHTAVMCLHTYSPNRLQDTSICSAASLKGSSVHKQNIHVIYSKQIERVKVGVFVHFWLQAHNTIQYTLIGDNGRSK